MEYLKTVPTGDAGPMRGLPFLNWNTLNFSAIPDPYISFLSELKIFIIIILHYSSVKDVMDK